MSHNIGVKYTEKESMGETETYEGYVRRMSEFYTKNISDCNPRRFEKHHDLFAYDKFGNLIQEIIPECYATKKPYVVYDPIRIHYIDQIDNEYTRYYRHKHHYYRPHMEQFYEQCGKCDAMERAVIALNKSSNTVYEFERHEYSLMTTYNPFRKIISLGCGVVRRDDIFTLIEQKINKGVSAFKQFWTL
jgi:hypothetical protein